MAKARLGSTGAIVKLVSAAALVAVVVALVGGMVFSQEAPPPPPPLDDPADTGPTDTAMSAEAPVPQPPVTDEVVTDEPAPTEPAPAPGPASTDQSAAAVEPVQEVNPNEILRLTLPDPVDLKALIDFVGDKLRLRFIYDERIQGQQVTIKPNQRVRVADLYGMLDTVLHLKGFMLVRSGDWVQVLPSTDTTELPIPDAGVTITPRSGETMVRELIPLRYADPDDLQNALTPFLSLNGTATAMPDQHIIAVTEYATKMEEIRRLIKLLDSPKNRPERRVVDLHYTDANELANILASVLAARPQARTRTVQIRQPVGNTVRIVNQVQAAPPQAQPFIGVNEQTNGLVLIGETSDLDELEAITGIYDVPKTDLQTVEYYYPVYQSAADLMQTIQDIGLAGTGGTTPTRTTAARRTPTAATGRAPATPTVQAASADLGGTGAVARLAVIDATNTLVVRARPDEQSEIKKFISEVDKPQQTEGRIRIYTLERRDPESVAEVLKTALKSDTVDQRTRTPIPGEPGAPTIVAVAETNSVIANASPAQHEEIAWIIRQLDAKQPQVLLECTLVEVTDRDNLDLGVELENLWYEGNPANGDASFGSTQFGFSSRDPNTGLKVLAQTGLTPVTGTGTTGATFAFLRDDIVVGLIRALETKSNGRVLSKPRLLCNNNFEDALIQSVDEEPVTQLDALTSNVSTVSFKEYIEAGTKLTITPHISDGNFLKLKINIEIGTFTGTSTDTNVPPPRATRTLTTEITVPDQRTIVIGGLTGKANLKTVDQVPFLGDIPILGEFFKHHVNTEVDTTIYLFVKATILRDQDFGDLYDATRQARSSMPDDLQKLDPTLTEEAAKTEAENLQRVIRKREIERALEAEQQRQFEQRDSIRSRGGESQQPIQETPIISVPATPVRPPDEKPNSPFNMTPEELSRATDAAIKAEETPQPLPPVVEPASPAPTSDASATESTNTAPPKRHEPEPYKPDPIIVPMPK